MIQTPGLCVRFDFDAHGLSFGGEPRLGGGGTHHVWARRSLCCGAADGLRVLRPTHALCTKMELLLLCPCLPRKRRASAVQAGFGAQNRNRAGCRARCGQEKHAVPPKLDVRAVQAAFSRAPPRLPAPFEAPTGHAMMASRHAYPSAACMRATGQKGAGRRKRERRGRSGSMNAPSPRTHGCESGWPPNLPRARPVTDARLVKDLLLLAADVRAHAGQRQAASYAPFSLLWGPI